MILTVPCSLSDAHLLPNLAKVLLKLGPYHIHKLLVVPTKEIEQKGREFANEVGSMFLESKVVAVDLGVTGWPIASNKHFKEVARLVCESKENEAWYFWEPDNTPLVNGWLDLAQAEYIQRNKPFWGAVIPTRGFVQGPNGSIPQDGEPHMVGTGIYPPNLHLFSVKLRTCDFHMPFNRLPLESFDLALRDECVPNAFATTLIQHNWQTKNYRVENDQIVCDDVDGITPELSHKKPWDGRAIIIHGCKDGSLAELVLADKLPKAKKPSPAAPNTTVVVPQLIAPVAAEVPMVDAPAIETPKIHQSFLATKIHKELNGGKMTAKGVAANLKITIPEVLAVIAEPGSGLKVAGPVKWVSIA